MSYTRNDYSSIIEAREVIHGFYLSALDKYPEIPKTLLSHYIGVSIKACSRDGDLGKQKDFIKLLNFLDFLETIGYLHHRQAVTAIEVNELLGNSIVYFFEIYKPYILQRRQKDPKFYGKLECLYNEVKKERNNN